MGHIEARANASRSMSFQPEAIRLKFAMGALVYAGRMSASTSLRRIAGTAASELRSGGVSGFCHASFRWLQAQRKYVKFDGCKFSLRGVQHFDIRLLLAQKTYEIAERRAIQRHLNPDIPVVELGGCMGVVACITNRLIRSGIHVVVEANPDVLPMIEANRAMNGCRFEVLNAAIGYDRPTVSFSTSPDLLSNSLRSDDGTNCVTVKTTQLKTIVESRDISRFTLICDIEGHECDLVEHEAETLRAAETIILETHPHMVGKERTARMMDTLAALGFQTVDADATVVVLRQQTIH